ncbi:MAG: hypothetical protein K2W82_14155 [Candidatus Obscuribacterales bacterium]|nr:hypothetical protein [Candidatus Obscuribacterales bacterium]
MLLNILVCLSLAVVVFFTIRFYHLLSITPCGSDAVFRSEIGFGSGFVLSLILGLVAGVDNGNWLPLGTLGVICVCMLIYAGTFSVSERL